MVELSQRVKVAINEHGLISQGERVVVALSGGGDSVALARLMCEMSAMASWSVVGFLHINHQLRSVANEDADFCRELSNELNVPFLIEKVNVEAVSREFGISVEEAGHRLRHEIFNRICRSQVADCVATGHTRDDLAETVLLRLIRGAGPRGLAGIHPRNGFVVRPLLDITRKELREYLEVQGLPHCEDTTNEDTSVARNRIRHLLIPFLKKNFSEGIVDVLAREASIARADDEWMEREVDQAVGQIVCYGEEVADIDCQAIAKLPIALARRVSKRVLEHVGGRPMSFNQTHRLLSLIRTPCRSDFSEDFPGSRLTRNSDRTRLVRWQGRGEGRKSVVSEFEYALPVPGKIKVPELGQIVSATLSGSVPKLTARGQTVAVSSERIASPLTVRNWRPGDVIRPLGLGGRKKLQDLFVDRKISRANRQAIPIVADSRGKIVWVAGQTLDEDFRVTDSDRGVLILKVMKLGESA
jgi:tRNA(Ile)-lysidine synthase